MEAKILFKDEIVVEIKAVKQLADEHRSQAINYLKATGKRFVNQALSRISRIS